MTWDDERTAALKQNYNDGLSCRENAAALGGVTRSAVIGKLNRLGLGTGKEKRGGAGALTAARIRSEQRGGNVDELNYAKRSRAKREANSAKARTRRQQSAADLRDYFAAGEIVDLPPDQSAVAVRFMQLSKDTCRWPIGDPRAPSFVFCGAKPIENRPYCERHSRMAFQQLERRPGYVFKQAAE